MLKEGTKAPAFTLGNDKGKKVKLYDRKEDIDRDLRGEAGERELKKLKRINAAAKRHIGPDAAVTDKEATRKINKAKEGAVK